MLKASDWQKGQQTPSPNSLRSFLTRPIVVGGLVLVAVCAWGFYIRSYIQSGPFKTHVNAAIGYTQSGQSRLAEREWWSAVRLQPQNASVWEQLGELYLSTGNYPAAIEPFRQLLRLKPDALGVRTRLAACLLRTGDEVGAFKHSQDELNRNPNSIAALAISAFLLGDMGEEQRRLDCLRRLVKLRPRDTEFLSLLAETLANQHNYKEAISLLDRIVDIEPENAVAYSVRGLCLLNLDPSTKGLARAEDDLRHALRLNPLAPFPRLYLGRLYLRRGDTTKALFQLEQAARLMPNKMDIHFELAGAYDRVGNKKKADKARHRFELLRREVDRIDTLVKRCASNPNDFANHLELGRLSLANGDYRRANFFLHKAQQLRPDSEAAKKALEQLDVLTSGSPPPGPLSVPRTLHGKDTGMPGVP